MRKLPIVTILTAFSLLAARGMAEDRLARDLVKALSRVETAQAGGGVGEQELAPLRPLVRDLEERHARREREFDRISRMELPPKAHERLARAREAHRAGMLPLLETLRGLVRPEASGERADARARLSPSGRLDEARAILGRMVASSQASPISAQALGVRAPSLRAPALGQASEATTEAPVGHVPRVLKDLSAGLGGPVDVYRWVRNTIKPEFYYGAMKGAVETYLEASGNDADAAALLVQLLRAQGVPARYARGTVELPGLALVALCGTASVEQAVRVLERGGIPHEIVPGAGGIATVKLERVWAEAYLPYANYRGTLLDRQGGTWIPLDPGFKRLGPPNTFDVIATLGFDPDASWRDYLAAPQASRPVEFVRGRISQLLTEKAIGANYEAILNTRDVTHEALGILPNSLPYKVVSLTEVSYDVPKTLTHGVRFVAERDGATVMDATFTVPELMARRLTLSYLPFAAEDEETVAAFGGLTRTPPYLIDVKATLRVGGVPIAAADAPLGMGVRFGFRVELQTPGGTETVSNELIAGNLTAIGLSGRGITASATPADHAASILADLARSYFERWNAADDELASLLKVVAVRPTISACLVMSAVDVEYAGGDPLYPLTFVWKGILIDADLRSSAPVGVASREAERPFVLLSGLEGSVLEHRVFEDRYQVESISTAKALGLAAAEGVTIMDVTTANVDAVVPELPFDATVLEEVRAAAERGWRVLIPAAPIAYHLWSGTGYVLQDEETAEAAYQLQGGYSGGLTAAEVSEELAEALGGQGEESEEGGSSTDVAHLTKVSSSDFQEATVDQRLPLPLKALATDEDGNPVEGATVTFVVTGGGGKLVDLVTGQEAESIDVLTDASGTALVVMRLGADTGDLPRYTCEPGIDCCEVHGTCSSDEPRGHATQVGLNQVTAFTRTALLDGPFAAFGYPDRSCSGGCFGRLEYVSDEGWYPNMLVAGLVWWVVEDQYGNPLSNFPTTLEYQPPPTLRDPTPEYGWYSRCRNEISNTPFTPGGVLTRFEYEKCAQQRTPVRQLDCPGAPSATSPSSAHGVAFYVVLGDSPLSAYRFAIKDSPGGTNQTLTFNTNGYVCYSPNPSDCPCAEPSTVAILTFPSHLVNRNGDLVEAYPPGGTARTGFNTDAIYEKESIEQVLDSEGNPHYFARGTNEWVRAPLDDSSFETAASTPGTQVTAVGSSGDGRYEGEMRMAPLPQLNSMSVGVEAYPPGIPYLPRVSPGVTPPDGLRHEVDPSFVDPNSLTLRERVRDQRRTWSWQDTFSLWGVQPRLTEVEPPVRVTDAGTVIRDSLVNGHIEPPAYASLLDPRQVLTDVRRGEEVFLAENTIGLRIIKGATLPEGEYLARARIAGVTLDDQPLVSNVLPVVAAPPCQLLQIVAPGATNLTLSSTFSPWDGTRCNNGTALHFELCQDAEVSLTIGGRAIQASTLTAGHHSIPLSTAELEGAQSAGPENAREFLYVLQARAVDEPTNAAARTGVITLQAECNRAVLPVGRTFVKGVDLYDGHLVRQATDLKVAGRHLGLEVTRTYASSGQDPEGLLGAGWSFNYESSLILSDCGLVVVKTADGSSQVFRVNAAGDYEPQPGYHTRLVRANDGSFNFFDKANVRHHFEGGLASRRRLFEIQEPHGDRLVLTYDGLDVDRVVEVGEVPRGASVAVRRLRVTYTDAEAGSGGSRNQPGGYPRIASVAIPELRLAATYDYDDFGNLVRVTRQGLNLQVVGGRDAEPTEERYEYSTSETRDRHQLLAVVDANGHRAEYEYFSARDPFPGEADGAIFVDSDTKQERVRVVREYPRSNEPIATSYVYDAREVLSQHLWKTKVTDPRGHSTLYVLNLNGSPVEIREPLGKTTAMRWATSDIYKEWERDALGRETDFSYDRRGNLTREAVRAGDNSILGAAPNGLVTTAYAYDEIFNKLTSKTDAQGRTTRYTIDAATGDLTDVVDAVGNHTHHEYDESGRLIQTTDPRGNAAVYSDWDSFGNPRRIDGPGSYWKERQYDLRGRLLAEQDGLGRVTETEYDGFDRIVETRRLAAVGSGDEVTKAWYYPDGQTRAVMNAAGAETEYTLDGLNRIVLATTTVPGGRSFAITTSYDRNGNKLEETDARGITRKFTYDALNRLVETKIDGGGLSGKGPSGVIAAYSYDLVGNKLTETDLNQLTTRFEYDGLYRVSRKVLPQPKASGTGNYEENFSSDAVGNLVSFTDANGHTTRKSYDGLNRLLSTTDPAGRVTGVEYDDPEGSHVNKSADYESPKGLRTSYLYDALNRETSRTVRLEGEDGDPATGALTYTTTTQYEDGAREQRITDARGVVSVRTLDGLDRVVEQTVDVAGLEGAPSLNLTTRFEYDGLGNKTAVTVSNAPEPDQTTRYDYDGLGRLIGTTDANAQSSHITYLADGLKESETDRRGVKRLFTYDTVGRLRTARLATTHFSGVGWSYETQYVDGQQPRRIETDARGKTTIFELDGMGRVTRETNADGKARSFVWDGVNKREETDRRGNRTRFEYDAANRLVKTTDPAPFTSQSFETTYADALNRVTEKDRRGILKVTQMDPLGRVLSVTRAPGTADVATLETNTYDAAGNKETVADAEGRVTGFVYDAANRVVSRTDGTATDDAATTTFKYDRAGNLLEERDARAAALDEPWSVKRTYDELNRLWKETDGENNTTTYGYDPEGNRTSVQTPRGRFTTFEYDELGKLTKVVQPPPSSGQPDPLVTLYAYDPNRNRTRQTDANGHVVTMDYDDLNRLTKTTQDPGGLDLITQTVEFDPNGNPLKVSDPKGQTITNSFDELNRLETRQYAPAPGDPLQPWRHTTSVEYSYDANNNLLRQDEAVASGTDAPSPEYSTSIVRTYDFQDRLASETTVLPDGGSKAVGHTYWQNGVRKTTTDPEAGVASYAYDGQNRLKTVTTSLGTSTYTYFGDDLLSTLTEPDGSVATHGYDKADRLLSVSHVKGASPIASYVYTYDANGNRQTQIETNGGAAETTTYAYDDLDRLERITYPPDDTYQNGRVVTYGYDGVGNRIHETEEDSADTVLAEKQGVFDNANRLTALNDLVTPSESTTFTWDPNGNQTSKTTNGVTTTNIYDTRDKLAEVLQGASILARYQYDAEGRLLKKIGDSAAGDNGIRQYVYDQTSRLVEFDSAGAAVARFNYGSDRLISMWHRTEGTRFYHLDGLRSVIALTDTAGAVRANLRLDTWGNFRFPETDLASTANRFAFTGHVFEQETGLYYAKARFLDPKLGRFISQDSFLGQMDAPPSLHRYLYANDNPARFIDPTGHEAFGVDIEMSGVVDPRTKEDVRRAEIRGAAGLAATVSWFGKAAWGMAQQAVGRGWEGFGEGVVEAVQHPGKAFNQAVASYKTHVNEQMDIAQERMARGDDWGAAWGFTENVTAPLATAVATVGEGVTALGKAVMKPIGPSLERIRVAMREASEAQSRAAEAAQARAIVAGRRGELGTVGPIMTDEQARAVLADRSRGVSTDSPLSLHFDPPLPGIAPEGGAGGMPPAALGPNTLVPRVVSGEPTAGQGGAYMFMKAGKIKTGSTGDFRGRYGPRHIEVEYPQTRFGPAADDTGYVWSPRRQRRFDEEFLDRTVPEALRYRSPIRAVPPVSQRKWDSYRHIFGYGDVPSDFGG